MLRHVISHLRRQDWMAVFIELVVVVVGVFIGVQASNWNEQRETDQKVAVFTERLRSDLREEAWGYEMQVGYWSQVLANAKRVADALDGKAPLPDEALLISAYRATQFNAYTRRRATYDELTSTGEIGLIRDSALRDLAMSLYTDPLFNGVVQAGQQSEYRKAFRMALPYQVQRALAERCGDHIAPVGDYRAIAHGLDYPCSTGLPPDVIAAGDDALRKDPHLLASLQLRIADVESDLGNMNVYYAHDFGEPLRRLAEQKP